MIAGGCLNGFGNLVRSWRGVGAGAEGTGVPQFVRRDPDQFLALLVTITMAIVASGYLFADELAYHVDVYQGDTPAALLDRHAHGNVVKSAAVLDIDVPGQTLPLPIEADEPVVVVGASPRTSVFVYGEVPEPTAPIDVLPASADAVGPAAKPTPRPDTPVAAAPPLPAPPASPPLTEPEGSTSTDPQGPTDPQDPDASDNRFRTTRRLRKPRAERGTRRAPRTLEIELV